MAHTFSKQLVAGTPENVNDVMTDLNEAAADWEGAFSSYKMLHGRSALMTGANAATFVFLEGGGLLNTTTTFNTGPTTPIIYLLDAADDETASPRTNKWQLRVFALTNATAPGVNFTFALLPVSAAAGGAGVISYTFSAAVTGSTIAITSPPGNATRSATSGDFTAPSSGWYAVGVTLNAGQAANSMAQLGYSLMYRQV